MLATVHKGGKIDETEIPPSVACGAPSVPSQPHASPAVSPDQHESDSAVDMSPVSVETDPVVMDPAPNTREESSGLPSPACLSSPDEEHTGSAVETLSSESSAATATHYS